MRGLSGKRFIVGGGKRGVHMGNGGRLGLALFVSAVLSFVAPLQVVLAQTTEPPEKMVSSGERGNLQAPLTPACRAAKNYIDLISQNRLDKMGGLFADQVDYVGPDAVSRSSGEEVGKLYAQLGDRTKSKAPKVRLGRLVPLHDNECFMEFDLFDDAAGRYKLTAIDHFIVGSDGRIVWFRPFFQQALNQDTYNGDKGRAGN
jgi:hypothetical protein